MVIRKNIPLSGFEKAQLAKSGKMTFLTKLPMPVMRWLVMRNIESLRRPKDFVYPIIPDCAHEIEHVRTEIDASPKKVGISLYGRKDDNWTALPHAGGKLPLLFFIHGGGFMGGDSLVSEGLMRYMADELGILCASVDYNVSPEVRYPVPLDDCCRALSHVLEHYPVDREKIFLSGDSAGGNLAAVMALKLQDEGGPVPKGQILLYPVTDLFSLNRESYKQKGEEYRAMRMGIRLSQGAYVPDKSIRKHPYVSPIYAEMLRPQPDAMLLIAERDGLRSDGLEYAEKLETAGGYSRCILYEGAFHSFVNDLFRSDIADDAAKEMLLFVKERI